MLYIFVLRVVLAYFEKIKKHITLMNSYFRLDFPKIFESKQPVQQLLERKSSSVIREKRHKRTISAKVRTMSLQITLAETPLLLRSNSLKQFFIQHISGTLLDLHSGYRDGARNLSYTGTLE